MLLCVKAALCKTRANSSAFSVPLPPSRPLPKLSPHLSVHAGAYPMPVLSFSLLRWTLLQRERKPSIDGQNAEQNENPSSKELFPMHVRHVPLPGGNYVHYLRATSKAQNMTYSRGENRKYAFCLTYIVTFCLAFYLTFHLTFYLAFYLAYIVIFYSAFFLTYILTC